MQDWTDAECERLCPGHFGGCTICPSRVVRCTASPVYVLTPNNTTYIICNKQEIVNLLKINFSSSIHALIICLKANIGVVPPVQCDMQVITKHSTVVWLSVVMFTDYKRARTELKKRSTDTLRLQKKVRKGSKTGDLQRRVESCMQDVNERRFVLEETEKKAVRAALIEERSRFCVFVAFMKPVVVSTVRQLLRFLY